MRGLALRYAGPAGDPDGQRPLLQITERRLQGLAWVRGRPGGIGWFGFLLCMLVLIVWGIVAFIRSRRTAATA
jgi:hypothetical protein